jgi:hypothetical protein
MVSLEFRCASLFSLLLDMSTQFDYAQISGIRFG